MSKIGLTLLLLPLLVLGVASAQGQTVTWDGGGDGTSWSDSANWNPAGVPTPASDVVLMQIDGDIGYVVVIAAGDFVTANNIQLNFEGATLQVDGSLTLSGTFELANGATAGAGEIVIEGALAMSGGALGGSGRVATSDSAAFTWTGGRMEGSGATTINGDATLTGTISSGTGTLPLVDRTLTFNGYTTLAVENDEIVNRPTIRLGGSAVLNVGELAVLDFTEPNTGIYAGSSPTRPILNNYGLIKRSAAPDGAEWTYLGDKDSFYNMNNHIIINNYGAVRAERGKMHVYMAEGSDMSGVLDVDAGAVISIEQAEENTAATQTIGGVVSGEGEVHLSSKLYIVGDWNVRGTTDISASRCDITFAEEMNIINLARLNVSGFDCRLYLLQPAGPVEVDVLSVHAFNFGPDAEPTLTLETELIVNDGFSMAGTVAGAGSINVLGNMTWRRGDILGLTAVDVDVLRAMPQFGGDFPTYGPTRTLDGTALTVREAALWDEGTLLFTRGATLEVWPEALFILERDGSFLLGSTPFGTERFVNKGLFIKSGTGRRSSSGGSGSAGSSYGSPVDVQFINNGIVSVNAGRLSFQRLFYNNVTTMGSDTLDISDPDLFMANSGIIAPGRIEPSNEPQGDPTIFPAELTVLGDYDNSNATIKIDIATGIDDSGQPFAYNDTLHFSGAVNLEGEIVVEYVENEEGIQDGPADTTLVLITAGSVSGEFDTVELPPNTQLQYTPTAVELVINTVTEPGPSEISWTGGAANGNWGAGENWDLSRTPMSGDTVIISHNFDSLYTIMLQNTAEIARLVLSSSAATLQVDGDLQVSGEARVQQGTLSGSGDITVLDRLVLSGGKITGSGVVTTNVFQRFAGNMSGSGSTIVQGDAEIIGGTTFYLEERTLTLQGATTVGVQYAEPSISPYKGATINITESGVLDLGLETWGIFPDAAPGPPAVLNNYGLMRIAAGYTRIGTSAAPDEGEYLVLNNYGTINGTGVVSLAGGMSSGDFISDGMHIHPAVVPGLNLGPQVITGGISGSSESAGISLGAEGSPTPLIIRGEFDVAQQVIATSLLTFHEEAVIGSLGDPFIFEGDTLRIESSATLTVPSFWILSGSPAVYLTPDLVIEDAMRISGEPGIYIEGDVDIRVGELDWNDGSIAVRSLTVVRAMYAGALTTTDRRLDGTRLTLEGGGIWDGGTLYFDRGAIFDVGSEAEFILEAGVKFLLGEQSGASAVVNHGIVVISDRSDDIVTKVDGPVSRSKRTSVGIPAPAVIAAPFVNDGILTAMWDTLRFTTSFANAGTVAGAGVLDLTLLDDGYVNSGSFSPGLLPRAGKAYQTDPVGSLKVSGDYDNAQARVEVEIISSTDDGGVTVRSDTLVIGGAASLGGSLVVRYHKDLNGDSMDDPIDTTFTILTAESVTGEFETVDAPKGISVVYEEDRVLLVAGSVAPPPLNHPPVAQPDSLATDEDVDVSYIDVLDNDSDEDGDSLFVAAISRPQHGIAEINRNGIGISYSPEENYHGADSLTYFVSDGNEGRDTAWVFVTIRPVNDAPIARSDTTTTVAGLPVTIDVLANDTDVDDDVLFVVHVTASEQGANVAVTDDQTRVSYSPAEGFSGEDAFDYVVSDEAGSRDTARVVVNVEPLPPPDNTPPIAVNDTVTTIVGEEVSIAVLANDVDSDADTLTIVGVGETEQGGDGTVNADGDLVIYTPPHEYLGEDSFDYVVSDGREARDTARVTVFVEPPPVENEPPVASDDPVTTPEDVDVVIQVVANDTDPNEDPLTVVAVRAASHGAVAIQGNAVQYAPELNYFGEDVFRYVVSDPGGMKDSALVMITVTPVNDPPVAFDDSLDAIAGIVSIIDVTLNDTDIESEQVSVLSADTLSVEGAEVRITDEGAIAYTAPFGLDGADTFSYVIADEVGATDEAQVYVDVRGVNYDVTDLGTLGGASSIALDVTSSGKVVGASLTGDGLIRGFIWDQSGMEAITAPGAVETQALAASGTYTVGLTMGPDSTQRAFRRGPGGAISLIDAGGATFAMAYDVNRSGIVVGVVSGTKGNGYRAFKWDGSQIQTITPRSGPNSMAFAVNDNGVIGGLDYTSQDNYRAFVGGNLYAAGSRVYAVNASGEAVGSMRTDGRTTGAMWDGEGTQTLLGSPDLAFSEAYDVSDSGWIVGALIEGGGATETAVHTQSVARATIRKATHELSATRVRRMLTSAKVAGKNSSVSATDTRAALWIEGQVYDLNSFVSEDSGWILEVAEAINGAGQIVGHGVVEGERRAYLLTPTHNAPPESRNDAVTVLGGKEILIDVLGNDSDADGDRLTILRYSQPSRGNLVQDSPSTLRYRAPAGFVGVAQFSYVTVDGEGGASRALVNITIIDSQMKAGELTLRPNYPNPFSESTRISYYLPEIGPVSIDVYSILGRRVKSLVNESQSAGLHEVIFDADGLANGVYFYRLTWNDATQTRQLVVVK